MNELMKVFGSEESMTVFENPMFGKVRVIEENGKTLFCGSDVASLAFSEAGFLSRALTHRRRPPEETAILPPL